MKPVELEYKEVNGIYHPQIQLSKERESDQTPLGKYGQMALTYLKEEHPNRYNLLLTEGMLMTTMHQVNQEAWEMLEVLQNQMLIAEPIPNPEETYQSYRHREMIKTRAEEIVLEEIVYKIR
ncbi:MAG: TnpV protein [Anaerosolibacter sp.]